VAGRRAKIDAEGLDERLKHKQKLQKRLKERFTSLFFPSPHPAA